MSTTALHRCCDRAALYRVILALGMSLALAPAASAQSTVTVDWGALDVLAAAPTAPAGRAIVLRPPAPRPIAVAVPSVPSIKPTTPATAAPAPPAATAMPAPAAPPPAPQRVASAAVPAVAAAAALAPGRVNVVRYAPGRSDVPSDGQGLLDSVAATLAADAKLRLELDAYASGSADDPVAARRVSLRRATELRSYLIGKGVPSVRMDVRALGDKNDAGGPADRVDLVIRDH